MTGCLLATVVLLGVCGCAGTLDSPPKASPAARQAPLMRNLMGVNGHTVQFRAGLYAKTCRLARDYHGFDWDVGENTDYKLDFPFSRNRVNWNDVYGSWKERGFDVDVSVMFGHTPPARWKDLPRDSFAYGEAFASFFGPSRGNGLVASVEIGNEPGIYDDATYRALFENMARGLRKGDPELKILPCNVMAKESGDYHKSVECLAGLEELYDALNIHVYAFSEMWPVWRRINPEDDSIEFLKEVRELMAWRDANVPDKPLWVTEFGWDACSKEPPEEGDASKFRDVSDRDQARYLVRAFLVFARMGVDRAYIFFFNDADDPSVHACSGLTRNYAPKPSYHAVAHLYRTLGEYRFAGVVEEAANGRYMYEFTHGEDAKKKIWVVWTATLKGERAPATLDLKGHRLTKVERMPLEPGTAPAAEVKEETGSIRFEYSGSPVYLFLEGAP